MRLVGMETIASRNTEYMNQATVYIICGFIGSGKTTFARKLERETGAIRITKDEWLIALFGHNPSIPGYEAYDRKICTMTRDMAFRIAEKGTDVILDEGFWSREERDAMRDRALSVGAKPVLYYLDTPVELMRKRVVGRNANPMTDAFNITDRMFDEYLTHWDPPGEDEAVIRQRR